MHYIETYYDEKCSDGQRAKTFTKLRDGNIVGCFNHARYDRNDKNAKPWMSFRYKKDLADGMETSLKAHGKPAA